MLKQAIMNMVKTNKNRMFQQRKRKHKEESKGNLELKNITTQIESHSIGSTVGCRCQSKNQWT